FDVISMLTSFFDGNAKDLADRGIPKNIADSMKKSFSLVEGKDLLDIKGDEFWKGLDRNSL
ncbi:MAG: hypothetical protein KAS11_05815, partial [Candidatus Aenigmarchaeota archaeon]|nr:hypothetical protein [Candidatus Aenigmarchaeota archaeon]